MDQEDLDKKENYMPVVEYMLHVYDGDHRRHIPGFIHDRGHWYNPSDSTWVGWVRTKTDFYVPDSLTQLTKEDFVQRCIQIHQNEPIRVPNVNSENPVMDSIELTTEEEVRTHAETWYDEFVARNLLEESGS
jgi:hypothetical protein